MRIIDSGNPATTGRWYSPDAVREMIAEATRERPKFVLYDKTETIAQSLTKDAATFGALIALITFSHWLGGGAWEFVTVTMFVLLLVGRMLATRTTKLRTKAEAKSWADSLPDDVARGD